MAIIQRYSLKGHRALYESSPMIRHLSNVWKKTLSAHLSGAKSHCWRALVLETDPPLLYELCLEHTARPMHREITALVNPSPGRAELCGYGRDSAALDAKTRDHAAPMIAAHSCATVAPEINQKESAS
jgi:hypothetical protein